MDRRRWEEEELIRVLMLYCDLPFGQLHSRNPKIVQLASVIGRTPSAIALKMVNFASLDPTISQKGMSNVSALDRQTWDKFFGNIDFYLANEPDLKKDEFGFEEAPQAEFFVPSSKEDTEAKLSVIARRGQERFRRAVLASYDNRCAISGIDDTRLLVASHIAPWALNVGRRLDPRNGICLNALLDRAFDTGAISITEDFEVVFSNSATPRTVEVILSFGKKFNKPNRFLPDTSLLREHAIRFGFS